MKVIMILCDICYGEDEVVKAHSKYWNDRQDMYSCCKKHLRAVKRLDLPHEEYTKEQIIREL